ncbi:UNVERIFIED_CONTAM: hypothetical protein GTU68_062792 [Idotea baltica]|nr:hypothetical protein [Idotea baltica]
MSIKIKGQNILHNVSLDVIKGEILTIVGPNGSGKSTLLRAIIGALTPTKGRISRQEKIQIGYVPQSLAIDATLPMSVDRFLSIPNPASAEDRKVALERVGANDLGHKQMIDLSGGQFQRVLLARALLCEPDLLLLDEPTQGLDQPGSARFYELLAELRAELNCAVVMVSHELHVVMSASDRVVCLNGHICCHGTPETVSNAPEYRALFGAQTGGALALYRHEHDHGHDHSHHSH